MRELKLLSVPVKTTPSICGRRTEHGITKAITVPHLAGFVVDGEDGLVIGIAGPLLFIGGRAPVGLTGPLEDDLRQDCARDRRGGRTGRSMPLLIVA
jgi:hypothetical protein